MKIAFYIILLLMNFAAVGYGGISFNGQYESSIDIYKENPQNQTNVPYKWHMIPPWNKIELRFFASPRMNIEFYTRVYAESKWTSHGNEYNIKFGLDDTHIMFKKDGLKGITIFTFAKEERFWMATTLMNLITDDNEKWDCGNAVGIRLDSWGYLGLLTKAFVAKLSPSWDDYGTDIYGVRIAKEFKNKIFTIGTRFLFKRWSSTKFEYNMLNSLDMQFNYKGYTITGEVAKSFTPKGKYIDDKNLTISTNYFKNLKHNKDDIAWKAEFRKSFRNLKFGFFRFVGSYRQYGKSFRSYLSWDFNNKDDNLNFNKEPPIFGREGFYIETQYRFPKKHIFLINKFDKYKVKYKNEDYLKNNIEFYILFVRNISLKLWYEYYHEKYPGKDNIWQHLFTQIEHENSILKIKCQFKIKNIDTEWIRYIYGLELGINFTERLKFYGRGTFIEEDFRNKWRKTIFLQISYYFKENTEFYLEYGQPDDSDEDIVNDDDFVENDIDIEHRIHTYLVVRF